MIDPIKPSEVGVQAAKTLPDPVIEAFNELIVSKYLNGEAKVLQKDAVARIQQKLGCDRSEVFDKDWLNVEEAFRAAGWTVTYEKPVGYGGETFEAFYTFRKK